MDFLRRSPACLALVLLAALVPGCSRDSSTPAAEVVSITETTVAGFDDSGDGAAADPPIVIGDTPARDGHIRVDLNPRAWSDISVTQQGELGDPYTDVHSVGHDHFWFGVELHTVVGPGWTGELGVFTTDCAANGICVRFDPDGGAGPIGPLTAGAGGEIDLRQLDQKAAWVILRNLVFVRLDGGPSYRIEKVEIDAR